jgi:hypothetical protein
VITIPGRTILQKQLLARSVLKPATEFLSIDLEPGSLALPGSRFLATLGEAQRLIQSMESGDPSLLELLFRSQALSTPVEVVV